MEEKFSIWDIILGTISVISIVAGLFSKDYQILLLVTGLTLLIFIIFGYYIFENKRNINSLNSQFNKIEESLNIYNRLNKLEVELSKMKKKGQAGINLIDIIKIGLAIILIYAFIKAITSM